MISAAKAFDDCLSLVDQLWAGDIASKPLWPAPYDQDTAEAAFKFVTECCWTLNEANGMVEAIPPHDYIRNVVREWHSCRLQGRPLIVEKSRRLIMSWVFRGLGLWRSGLRMEKGIITGLNYPKAAEHVWRVWWLHNELVKRRPEFGLKPAVPRGGNVAAQELEQVMLPNGSLIESLNQEGASFQGSGYSWVDMEEFSLYKHCDYMYAQALRVTEGKPGHVGGLVSIITNSSPSKAFHELKS